MGAGRRIPEALAGVLLSLCAAACTGAATVPGEGSGTEAPRTVVFLADSAEATLAPESTAAWRWLSTRPEVDARYLLLADLDSEPLPPGAILWFHHARAPELPSSSLRAAALDAARAHVAEGGHLLLSLFGVSWAVPLGIETRPPNRIARVPGTDFVRWNENDDRVLAGFQTYRGHPLLRRFWGGTYTATPDKGREYAVARWEGDAWPEQGRVVAVARRYIGIDTGKRTLVEYPPAPGGGRVVTVGEGLWFDDGGNRNRVQLETFALDLFAYLDGDPLPAPPGASIPSRGAPALPAIRTAATGAASTPPMPPAPAETPAPAPRPDELPGVLADTTHWTPRGRAIRSFTPAPAPAATPATGAAVLEAVTASRSGLALEAAAGLDVPFDLYGPLTLLVGRQSGRVDDLWTFPYRALRGLHFAVLTAAGTVLRLDDPDATRTFIARPEGDTLRVARDGLEIALHLAVQRERGGLVALVQVTAPEPVTLLAEWEADHGALWPREAELLGDLLVGWDTGAHGAAWRDPDGVFHARAGFGREPSAFRIGEGMDALIAELAPDTLRPADPAPAAATPDTIPERGPEPALVDTPVSDDGVDPDAAADPALDSAEAVPDDRLPSARIAVAVPFDPARDVALPFVVVAGDGDAESVRNAWVDALEDPAAVWTGNANHWRQFLGDTLDIATPDPTFDEAFRWAKVGLEAFRVTTPGLGTGLTAGYAASKDPAVDTWHAENDFLRRPGYGWYFGRDAVWTALAADAYGGTDLTSEALRFLARYQDVDGKILHEMSPSWVIHYDAADSTPLFLLGLDHHVRATGDRELLRTLWPAVGRAMAFLESTDTDGDGLIENTGVGHGWIEGGRFYGAHATFYLANLWAATLTAVERMATWMADQELASAVAGRGEEVRQIIEAEFWDPARRTYHHGKRADGTFMPVRTILPAVGMVLGVLDERRVPPLLDMFAGADVASDWGSRMVEQSNPDYDPAGYHDGSVWPLFSGWTSLAGYRYHRPLAAFTQLNANLRLYRAGNLGYLPEVLHGDRFEIIGVTQHQAWSQAMALLPAVEGMLGIRTDAMAGRVRIHPHLPAGWNRVVVQRVRSGANTLRITVVREDEATRFEIERLTGTEPIQLELSLPFPRAVLVNLDRDATRGVALVEPETIVDHPTEKEALVVVSPTEATSVVVFRHSPYPQVTPLVHAPEPGGVSRALRIIDSDFRAGQLQMRIEGLPGRTYRITLATPWPVAAVSGVPTATIATQGPGRAAIEVVLPGESNTYQRAELRIEFRR